MKFSINLYNLMQSTRMIIDNRIFRFSPADKSRRKSEEKSNFLRLCPKSINPVIYNNSSRLHSSRPTYCTS